MKHFFAMLVGAMLGCFVADVLLPEVGTIEVAPCRSCELLQDECDTLNAWLDAQRDAEDEAYWRRQERIEQQLPVVR